MFYFLCKIITVIKMNKLTYLAYIGDGNFIPTPKTVDNPLHIWSLVSFS